MKQLLINSTDCHLMIWPINVSERKPGCTVKLIVNKKLKLTKGDRIGTGYGDAGFNTWLVDEIVSSRPSAKTGFTFYEIKSTFKSR